MTGWIFRPAPRPTAVARIFCFPYAGVGAAIFRLWPQGLPAEVEVCAIELPGRGARLRETPVPSIPSLVDQLIPALRPNLDRPFVFFGHSMGAVLATEVARGLAAAGERMPAHLIVSARRPPHVPDGQQLLHPLDDARFVAEINRRYGGIPQQLLDDAETLALLLPALRADVEALERHTPDARAPLPFPISVFGGSSDRMTPREHLDAWRGETDADFRVRVFPGGHFYVDSQRSALLADVSGILSAVLMPRAITA